MVNNIIGGDEAALEAAALAFVKTQSEQNVSYVEVRYDPKRAARSSYAGNVTIPLDSAVRAIQRGLARGLELSPPVEAHQLLCAMRDQPAAKCLEVAVLAAEMKDGSPGGVVGMDLAGNEWTKLTNTSEYVPCFRKAKELGLNTTIHVGETLPWPLHSHTAEDVWIAAVEMGCVYSMFVLSHHRADSRPRTHTSPHMYRVDRIGHGYAMALSATSTNATIVDAVRSRGIHLEACPYTSNGEGSIKAIGVYRELNLSFGINTDDPCMGCSGAPRSIVADEKLTRDKLGFQDADLEEAYREARKHAFAA